MNSGPARKVPMQFALGEDEKNTAVDISKTNAYEERGLSLDFKEAGYEIEPFNLEAEREGGKFDQDGTYIPKRRRGRVRRPPRRCAFSLPSAALSVLPCALVLHPSHVCLLLS